MSAVSGGGLAAYDVPNRAGLGDVVPEVAAPAHAGGEGQGAAVELVNVLSDQLADGGNRAGIEIGAVPSPASLPQEITNDPVVGADVEIDLVTWIVQVGQNLPEFRLLQEGAIE